jgi:alpha-D-xyloside xylohydrolase
MQGTLAVGLMLGCLCTAASAEPALLNRNGSFVVIEGYAPNIVRITISQNRALALAKPGYGLIGEPDASWSHAPGSSGSDLFESPQLSVVVEPAPAPAPATLVQRYFLSSLPPVVLEVRNAGGETLLKMLSWEMAPHVVNGEMTFQVGASFQAPRGEHYYGLGQNQEGFLDHRGRTIDCKHDYGAPAGETVCVPFMVTNRCYAIVWDNPSETIISTGLDGKTSWRSKVGERVSFFVISGRTADDLYAGYKRLTGATPLPPKAAFGYIQSKARYETQRELLDVAAGYRQRGYPVDVMVLDWFYWTKMGEIDIDPAFFPDPSAMNKALHNEGIRSIISVWPRFERGSRYFDFLQSKGWLLKEADGTAVDGAPFRNDRAGGLIDSTNPDAREWFWSRIRDNLASKGFDWFWLDETEPDLVPDGHFYGIGSGDRFHNVFPLLHTEGVAEGSRRDRPQKRNLILARAAYLGSQRYGSLFWSSDINPTWDTLRRQIPTGLNFAASGLAYWGNDIGGWQPLPQSHRPERPVLIDPSAARAVIANYDDYPELITRWYEYATFTPTMRAHGWRPDTAVWSYGKQAEAVISRYLKLRYALMPYLYSLAKHTYDTGAPLMRALFMDFPTDSRVLDVPDEYMFGPAFLVAPVVEQGMQTREVYLPACADWFNYWTNQRYAGGQTIAVAAPIDQIPLFVRAGSIIPFGVEIPSTATAQAIAEIRVYPGADADFALYDDDGVSYDYERGAGRTTALHWSDKQHSLSVDAKSTTRIGLQKLLRIIAPT